MRESRNNIALRVCKIAVITVITHAEGAPKNTHCALQKCRFILLWTNKEPTFHCRSQGSGIPVRRRGLCSECCSECSECSYIYYTTEYRDLFLQGPEATPIRLPFSSSCIIMRAWSRDSKTQWKWPNTNQFPSLVLGFSELRASLLDEDSPKSFFSSSSPIDFFSTAFILSSKKRWTGVIDDPILTPWPMASVHRSWRYKQKRKQTIIRHTYF